MTADQMERKWPRSRLVSTDDSPLSLAYREAAEVDVGDVWVPTTCQRGGRDGARVPSWIPVNAHCRAWSQQYALEEGGSEEVDRLVGGVGPVATTARRGPAPTLRHIHHPPARAERHTGTGIISSLCRLRAHTLPYPHQLSLQGPHTQPHLPGCLTPYTHSLGQGQSFRACVRLQRGEQGGGGCRRS